MDAVVPCVTRVCVASTVYFFFSNKSFSLQATVSLLHLGFTIWTPSAVWWSTDLWDYGLYWKRKGCNRGCKGPESVKIHYRLTGRLPLSPSPSSSSGKGVVRRREGSKEEMTNWENYFAICGTSCVQVFEDGGKVAFSPAHAERLRKLRSKLSPCWKVTALHDRSTSLSTLLFTFLPWLGSNFTFSCKLANAIYHLQPEKPLLGLTKAFTSPTYTVPNLYSLVDPQTCQMNSSTPSSTADFKLDVL